MASNNEKMMIPVPTMGLREDVDRSVSDPNMVVTGENIVSVDGTIRPRPCHRLSSLNGTQGLSWSTPWNSEVEGYSVFGVSALHETGDTTGYLLANRFHAVYPGSQAVNEYRVIYSADSGANWGEIAISGEAIYREMVKAFIVKNTSPDVVDQVYWWGHDGDGMTVLEANFTNWVGDPANNSLYFSATVNAYNLGVARTHDACTFTRGDFDDSNDMMYGFYKAVNGNNSYLYKLEFTDLPLTQAHTGYVVTLPMPSGYTVNRWEYLTAKDGYIWIVAYTDDDTLLLRYDAESGEQHLAPVKVYDRTDHGMETITDAGIDATGTSLMLVGGDFLKRLVVATEIFSIELYAASADFKVYEHDGTKEFALGLELYMSPDNWTTIVALQSSPSDDQRLMTFIEYPSDPGEYNWFSFGIGPDGGGNIYNMPDEGSAHGECTNLFQLDLPTEPYAIFNGTTNMILKFNRSTGAWDDLTFGSKSDSANYPDSSVTFDGSLGTQTLPNDSYYMQGSRENHPTVFRSFEQGGKTWVLATNGVQYPMMWNEDMIEFEPIGYGDDGAASFPDADFILPPISSSMAVVGNRIIFGDDSNITFSHLNDHRQGWDIPSGYAWTTYALLGDTPGKIVTIMEITALAAAIHKEDAIYHAVVQAEFLGQNAPFRFELVKSGVSGPVSPNAVVRMLDGRQAYLSNDGGVYLYDGVSPNDVGRHVRNAIQNDLDEYTLGLSWGMMDPYNKLLWFFYPTQNGRTNRGIMLQVDQPPPWPAWRVSFPFGWDMAAGGRIFNFADKSIGSFGDVKFGEVPDKLGDFASGLYEMSVAKADNTWFVQKWSDDGHYTDGSIPIFVKWIQGWEAISDPFRFATAQECQHLIYSDDPNFEIQFRLEAEQANVNDIEIEDWEHIGPSSHYSKTTHRITGKRFAPSFLGNITRAFKWGGLGLYYYMRGLR